MNADFNTASKVLTTVNGVQRNVLLIYQTINGVFVNIYSGAIIIRNIPYASVVYWNGSVVTPTWIDYDETILTIDGTLSATDVGTYSVTFTPKDGCKWSDGTTDAKTVQWSIQDDWATVLRDFNYTVNNDGTATITGWKRTLNGVSSTDFAIPDYPRIVL